MTNRAPVSIGVAAAIGPQMAAALAPAIEAAGFRALWVNDTPGADALALLEAAASVTSTLTLATGVIPVDRRSAASIAGDVRTRGLPQNRLRLGIGAGGLKKGALERVGAAASALRSELDAQVVVGALGPKMRHLAVADSDGVLLSWLTPEIARTQASEAHAVSPRAYVALYVRTALDPAAGAALYDEAARYASSPAYRANFERHGITAGQTVLDPASEDLAQRLEDYRNGPDEVVLRVITPTGSLEDHLRFIETARALL
jgi:alkanesulfonate monooxygenase SsuD/methylene tetrahydromethanopterin reductase-like flavin-dependent oxidoreductase (luciferase family)